MLCTVIRQIAVEINSNYGPGFKSITFPFYFKLSLGRVVGIGFVHWHCRIAWQLGEERVPT